MNSIYKKFDDELQKTTRHTFHPTKLWFHHIQINLLNRHYIIGEQSHWTSFDSDCVVEWLNPFIKVYKSLTKLEQLLLRKKGIFRET